MPYIRHLYSNKMLYRQLNDAVCPLVNVKLILKHKDILRGKLKKDFAFEIEIYSRTSVWKNLKFIWHCIQALEAVAWRCSVRKAVLRSFARSATLFCEISKNTFFTEHLCWLFFSPHNHKLLTEFNFIWFCQHFDIKKY